VDYLGRTESEAEEESELEQRGGVRMDSPSPEKEEEGDVVAHPGIKPMWLLRFFTSWGARWSASAATAIANPPPAVASPPEDTKVLEGKLEGVTEKETGETLRTAPGTAESPGSLPSSNTPLPEASSRETPLDRHEDKDSSITH
jgi:hypothetical protein